MNQTPNAERLHVVIYGRRNSGKSSLINAITGESTSIVSEVAGTTTDNVMRAMELHGVGALLFIDTPGFDDQGKLGEARVERAGRMLERSDIAILLCDRVGLEDERKWYKKLKAKGTPVIPVINKCDIRDDIDALRLEVEQIFGEIPLVLSATSGVDIESIRESILSKILPEMCNHSIVGDLAQEGDVVVLVMPQDHQAPKGRLILPQVQTMRELLDKRCLIMSCTTDLLEGAIEALGVMPKLIITDSQDFKRVAELTPKGTLLTSFSVLMAGYKGDIDVFMEGAKSIDSLTVESKVLIAEACAHAPLGEDIGRVKIPRLLRQKIGESLQIDIVSGRNFPHSLSEYDLIIHCGGCMFNRKYVMHRIAQAQKEGVAITNYGVTIAHLSGIIDRVTYNNNLK